MELLRLLRAATAFLLAMATGAESGEQWGIVSPLGLTTEQIGSLQIERLNSPPLRYVETRSERAVTLGLDRLEQAWLGLGAADLRLVCDGDPGCPGPMRPMRVGYDRQVVGFGGDDGKLPLYGARIHLLFAQPLKPGLSYRLEASPEFSESGDPIPVVWRPERVSGSIQVNQLGYVPAGPKIAFLGNWLGTAGPLPVDNPGFRVLDDKSGRVVDEGRAVLRAPADPWSGNAVYAADFSALRTPGTYRIAVPGLGVSYPFRIAPDVYGSAYRTVLRLFYHSRNGTPILAPWADRGHERPQGGVPAELDGVYQDSVADSALGCAEGDCKGRRVSRGWFDAGDYGQYVTNAVPVWYFVAAGMDLAPGRFRDRDLAIPESGNAIPDVVDELEWGMDWLLGMQDRGDGGVYSRIASRNWDSTLPHRLTEPRLIAEKTTHATASFAAAAAIHARLVGRYKPQRARETLAAAERAWSFLETHPQWPAEGERYKNPPGVHAGEYADPSALDNKLWAAAELYRTTGEDRYRTAYETLAPRVRVDPTAPVSYKDQTLAAFWAWTLAEGEGRDPDLVRKARDEIVAAARWYDRMAQAHPYGAPMHRHIPFIGWGSFAHSTRATLPLLQGYRLTGDPGLLKRAWESVNPQLGANPQSICYITGLGARSPRYPLSKLSQYDEIDEPLAGIPVTGPHWHVPASWPEMAAVNSTYLPPSAPSKPNPKDPADFAGAYPALRRYTDAQYLPQMSEPTVADYARGGVAYGLLRKEGLAAEIAASRSDDRAEQDPAANRRE